MLTKTANDKTSSDSNAFEYFYPEFLFLGNHPQIRCVSVFPPRRLGIKQIFHSWIIRRIPRTVFRSGFFFLFFSSFFDRERTLLLKRPTTTSGIRPTLFCCQRVLLSTISSVQFTLQMS